MPLLVWVITGLVFLFKPGYGQAYQPLHIKQYPLPPLPALSLPESWQNLRVVRSVVGLHFLASDGQAPVHYFLPMPMQGAVDTRQPLQVAELSAGVPLPIQVERLVSDAIESNPSRFGQVVAYEHPVAETSTGVKITVDWLNLSLRQQGQDTRFINALYKAHYMQWWGVSWLNQAFAVLVLGLLVTLSVIGVMLMMKAKRKNSSKK